MRRRERQQIDPTAGPYAPSATTVWQRQHLIRTSDPNDEAPLHQQRVAARAAAAVPAGEGFGEGVGSAAFTSAPIARISGIGGSGGDQAGQV